MHLQRNAKTHLHKADASEFQQRGRVIKSYWNPEVAQQQFEQLCDRFAKSYPSFIAEVRKKRPHYLAFIAYPEAIRRSFSTTNAGRGREWSTGNPAAQQWRLLPVGGKPKVETLVGGFFSGARPLAKPRSVHLHGPAPAQCYVSIFQSRFEAAA